VRLLITRSGGPSPNTDVYEVELFGKAPSAAEMKKRVDEPGLFIAGVFFTTSLWVKLWLTRQLTQGKEVAYVGTAC